MSIAIDLAAGTDEAARGPKSWLCRIGLHRWRVYDGTLIGGVVCDQCGKVGWDW